MTNDSEGLAEESGLQLIAAQPFSMPAAIEYPDWYLEFRSVWLLCDRGEVPSVELLELIPTYKAWRGAGNTGTIGDWAKACCPDLGEVVSMAHGYRDG